MNLKTVKRLDVLSEVLPKLGIVNWGQNSFGPVHRIALGASAPNEVVVINQIQGVNRRRKSKEPPDSKEMINPTGNNGEYQGENSMRGFESFGQFFLFFEEAECSAMVREPSRYSCTLVDCRHARNL